MAAPATCPTETNRGEGGRQAMGGRGGSAVSDQRTPSRVSCRTEPSPARRRACLPGRSTTTCMGFPPTSRTARQQGESRNAPHHTASWTDVRRCWTARHSTRHNCHLPHPTSNHHPPVWARHRTHHELVSSRGRAGELGGADVASVLADVVLVEGRVGGLAHEHYSLPPSQAAQVNPPGKACAYKK